ncbi:MAG: hypothetical protein IID38_10000 [Planctomycetes bacterium]|nr:hypothetical protein [Planctomycetota bacterium]
MRNAIALLIVVGVGVGVWKYLQETASDEIKNQMLLILDDMDLSAQEREEVRPILLQYQEQAFTQAMDISKRHGRKFDEKSYYDEVFNLVVGELLEKGNVLLAEKVKRLQTLHSLIVTER